MSKYKGASSPTPRLLYILAAASTVFFYFAYSVVPAIYAIVSIYQELPVYFWLKLSDEKQFELAITQLVGFFILLITLPRNARIPQVISGPRPPYSKTATFLLIVICIYTVPAALEMLYRSMAVQGRNDLFLLSTEIIGKYKLQPCFLVMTALVLYQFLATKKLKYIFYIIPLTSIEIVALGRALPFAAISLFSIMYVTSKESFPNPKKLFFVFSIFIIFSLSRMTGEEGQLDLLQTAIYVFGEAFNTQRTIEIAILSESNVSTSRAILNVLAEFIPFGVKSLLIDSASLPMTLIDGAKEAVYGTEIAMGFGSSWVSQYIIYFGDNFMIAAYPVILSISLRIFLYIQKNSFTFGCIYLYFYLSGLFVFMRYGLTLALSYPATNLLNVIVLIAAFTVVDRYLIPSKGLDSARNL